MEEEFVQPTRKEENETKWYISLKVKTKAKQEAPKIVQNIPAGSELWQSLAVWTFVFAQNKHYMHQ